MKFDLQFLVLCALVLFISSSSGKVVNLDQAQNMPHLSPHPEDELRLGAEGFDQKAFLGSASEAKGFQALSYEDKIKGLTQFFKRIDNDKSKTITFDELNKWVLHSITNLKTEEAERKFKDHDNYDSDGKFTWEDHLYNQFGFVPTEDEIKKGVPGAEGTIEEHKFQMELFRICDENKDSELSLAEFHAFFRPEDFAKTQKLETKRILAQFDSDKDGALNVKEFLKAELNEDDPKEWIPIETERFHVKWDANKDGLLKGDEIRAWQMPANAEVAKEETAHLFSVADENEDSSLTLPEILKHYETFGGSQATNWGQHILDEL